MRQSSLSPLIITMAAEAMLEVEATGAAVDDDLVEKIMQKHKPFERGSYGYHLRTVRSVCGRPTRIVKARCDEIRAERVKPPPQGSLF